jgi:hypothetical protein
VRQTDRQTNRGRGEDRVRVRDRGRDSDRDRDGDQPKPSLKAFVPGSACEPPTVPIMLRNCT